jgi:F-type H+-transporting ATPase subunit delta
VQYHALRDERYGIVNVDVAGAIEITPQQQQRLAEQLERYTRKKVRLRFSIDKALQGGLRVKIGDTVLDATIKHQLELLREKLAHGQLSN